MRGAYGNRACERELVMSACTCEQSCGGHVWGSWQGVKGRGVLIMWMRAEPPVAQLSIPCFPPPSPSADCPLHLKKFKQPIIPPICNLYQKLQLLRCYMKLHPNSETPIEIVHQPMYVSSAINMLNIYQVPDI